MKKTKQIHANFNKEIKVGEKEGQTSPAFMSPNDWHTKQWNKEFTSLEQQIESMIITPKMNVHGEIKRMANVLKTTFSRLKKLDIELLDMKGGRAANSAGAYEGHKRSRGGRASRCCE